MRQLCIFFLLLVLQLQAQDSLKHNRFEPSFHGALGYLPKTYPVAPTGRMAALASFCAGWRLGGKDAWHAHYHYPRGGAELVYTYFNNPGEMGFSVGVVPFLELNKSGRQRFVTRIGFGLAYFNRPYDAVSNPNNYYIGAHVTNLTMFSALWKKPVSNKGTLVGGFTFIHCSNGHTALPNVGLNFLAATVGFVPGKPAATPASRVVKARGDQKLSYALKAGLGKHEFGVTTKAVGGPSYPSYHVSGWVSKPYGSIHLWQLGITGAYYTSFYDYLSTQNLNAENRRLMACTGLLFAGHEFVFGKFSLSTQLGLYVWNRFFIDQMKRDGEWNGTERLKAINSNRLGILYYPFKKQNSLNNVKGQLMLGAFLKANLAQADLVEWSIGYVF